MQLRHIIILLLVTNDRLSRTVSLVLPYLLNLSRHPHERKSSLLPIPFPHSSHVLRVFKRKFSLQNNVFISEKFFFAKIIFFGIFEFSKKILLYTMRCFFVFEIMKDFSSKFSNVEPDKFILCEKNFWENILCEKKICSSKKKVFGKKNYFYEKRKCEWKSMLTERRFHQLEFLRRLCERWVKERKWAGRRLRSLDEQRIGQFRSATKLRINCKREMHWRRRSVPSLSTMVTATHLLKKKAIWVRPPLILS